MSGILIYIWIRFALRPIFLPIDCLVGKDLFRSGAAEGSKHTYTRECVFVFGMLFRRHRKTSKSRSILRAAAAAAKFCIGFMNIGQHRRGVELFQSLPPP
jgi:hypothetical protein